MTSNHRADGALKRARQAAASLKPVARGGSAAAQQGVRATRAWAAPQLERTGHVVQDRIAPKISSLLSSAARRIEPGKPPRRPWGKVAGVSMVTAAASAVAGAVLHRQRQNGTHPGTDAASHEEAAAGNDEAGAEADTRSRSASS